jgi:hypothetical protein
MRLNRLLPIGLTFAVLAVAVTAKAISIIPTYVDGAGYTWDSIKKGVIGEAISEWQALLPDSRQPINVTLDFTHAGTANYLGQWEGGWTLPVGTNIYPWTSGVTHTIHYNADLFSGTNYTWWDPTPTTSADQPFQAWDALSVARHEIGHMLGFTDSFYFDELGQPQQIDKWDSHISGTTFDPGGLNVSMASTYDLGHLRDSGSTAGDLMVSSLANGHRREISGTDLRMLHLAYGYTIVPEPSTIALLLTATLGGLLWWRRR